MPFKVTFFFQQQSALTGGWSENFWNSALDLTQALAASNALVPLLQNLHGDQTIMTNARISESPAFRAATLYSIIEAADPDLSKATTSDYPTTALLFLLTNGAQYITRQWIKGLPDNIVRQSGRYDPVATYIPKANAFFAAILTPANGWVMRVLDKAIPKKIVQAITQQGVCTVTGHGYNTNAKVRISRAKNLKQANGIWRITNIDADTFSLQGWVEPTVATPYLGNGTVQLQSYIFVPPTTAKFDRATSHRVGRPFGLLGGRRRSRRT